MDGEFNPELADSFASLIGIVSPIAEKSYRLGLVYREQNPFLSNFFMLGFIALLGKELLD